jgi:sugar (pentulose or hexulose) kinase
VTSLLGIDLGASSVKAALFEADSLHHWPPYIHEIQKNIPAITSNISGSTPSSKTKCTN